MDEEELDLYVETMDARLHRLDVTCPEAVDVFFELHRLSQPECWVRQFAQIFEACVRRRCFGAAILAAMHADRLDTVEEALISVDNKVLDVLLAFVNLGRFSFVDDAAANPQRTCLLMRWAFILSHKSGQALRLLDTLCPLLPHDTYRQAKLAILCSCGPQRNLPLFYKTLDEVRRFGWRLEELTTLRWSRGKEEEEETLFSRVLLDFMRDRCDRSQSAAPSAVMVEMVCRVVEMGLATHHVDHVRKCRSVRPYHPLSSNFCNRVLLKARQSGSVDVVKLLYRTGAITNSDCFHERELPVVVRASSRLNVQQKQELRKQMDWYICKKASQPRSLQKACLLRISHVVGCGADRKQKVLQLELSSVLKENLLHRYALTKFVRSEK